MKYFGLFVALFMILVISAASTLSAADYQLGKRTLLAKEDSKPEKADQKQSTEVSENKPVELLKSGDYICWSANHCTGKELNHKDRHNCKNSGGKSWTDRDGTCYPL